jgi:hypothetical protein
MYDSLRSTWGAMVPARSSDGVEIWMAASEMIRRQPGGWPGFNAEQRQRRDELEVPQRVCSVMVLENDVNSDRRLRARCHGRKPSRHGRRLRKVGSSS